MSNIFHFEPERYAGLHSFLDAGVGHSCVGRSGYRYSDALCRWLRGCNRVYLGVPSINRSLGALIAQWLTMRDEAPLLTSGSTPSLPGATRTSGCTGPLLNLDADLGPRVVPGPTPSPHSTGGTVRPPGDVGPGRRAVRTTPSTTACSGPRSTGTAIGGEPADDRWAASNGCASCSRADIRMESGQLRRAIASL